MMMMMMMMYLTCSKKLTCSQLSLPHGTNRKILVMLSKLRSLAFALSTYGIVSLLTVWISPRLLPLNALKRIDFTPFLLLSRLTKT